MTLIEQIEERMRRYLQPDENGEVMIEFGDYPIYGDGRQDHKFTTRVERIQACPPLPPSPSASQA